MSQKLWQHSNSTAECKLITDVSLFTLWHQGSPIDVEEAHLVTTSFLNTKDAPGLHDVLAKYQDIFEEPIGLPPATTLPTVDDEGNFIIQPLQVIESRQILTTNGENTQVRVGWMQEECKIESWEDLPFIQRCFPLFDPWGQDYLNPGYCHVHFDE